MKAAYFLLISLTIFYSCNKPNGGDPTPPDSTATVYVSGNCWDSLAQRWVAVYWEDAIPHYLTGSNGTDSYGRAIAWSNNELLIAGQARSWVPAGGLWVNGIPQDLGLTDTASLSDVLGIYVSGSDIYLAGFGVNSGADYSTGYAYAKVWKNGTITRLNNSPGFARAAGVTVVGQDVYVAWTEQKNGFNLAMYNKNENSFVLESLSPDVSCQAICSSGTDVYIAGNAYDSVSKKNHAVYWENGAPANIPVTNEDNTYASGIAAAGSDVYISGMAGVSNSSYAVYWKNGTEHRITDGSLPAVAYGIALSGADIYTAGTENFLPVYWKNDVPHKLQQDNTHTSYQVTGIVVVQK